MNRAMIFPIHKKWDDMIFDGTKKFEFRNKLPKHLKTGVKIYLYEALGDRKPIHLWEAYPLYIQHRWSKNEDMDELSDYVTEGSGMIVGEFTVGEIYELEYDKKYDTVLFKQNGIVEWENSFSSRSGEGYTTDQKYAIEITNVIKYDEEWQNYIMEDSEIDDLYFTVLEDAPTEPIAKEEFVSWNKLQELLKSSYGVDENNCDGVEDLYVDTFYETIDYLKDKKDVKTNIDDLRVQSPIQAPMYVVEKDDKTT